MSSLRTSLRRRPLLALIILIVLLLIGYTARGVADHRKHTARAPATVALSSLPEQARQTVQLIQRHGPYRYREDGGVYQNQERELPSKPIGYYHEYTVDTPGSQDRGARRIVTGSAGEFYYTDDHYASFRRIDLSG